MRPAAEADRRSYADHSNTEVTTTVPTIVSDGKIQRFNCYAAGTIMFAQLGVLSNLGAALAE